MTKLFYLVNIMKIVLYYFLFILHFIGLFLIKQFNFLNKIFWFKVNKEIIFGSLFCLYIFYIRIIYTRPLGSIIKMPISNYTLFVTILVIILFTITLIITVYMLFKKSNKKNILPIWILNSIYKWNSFIETSLMSTSLYFVNYFSILTYITNKIIEPYIIFMKKRKNLKIIFCIIYGIPIIVSLSFFIDMCLCEYKYFPYVVILLIIPLIIKMILFVILTEAKPYYKFYINYYIINVTMLNINFFTWKDENGLIDSIHPYGTILTDEQFHKVLMDNFERFNYINHIYYLSEIRWQTLFLNRVFKKHRLIARAITLSLFLLGWIIKLYFILKFWF